MGKKIGLGKGLASLIGDIEQNNEQKDVLEVDINLIQPHAGQPRTIFSKEHLKELQQSIKEVGILQPILVRPYKGFYQIIAGERRYQAAKTVGLTSVPVIVKNFDDVETMKVALIENIQRCDLNVVEEARAFKKLIKESKMTQEQLAQAVSKSRSAITNALRLLELPDEILEFLQDNKITAGHARALLSVDNDDTKIKLAHKIIAEKLSVRETEKIVPLFKKGELPRKTRVELPQEYKRAAKQLRRELGTMVKVKTVGNKNKLEIEFKTNEELQNIIQRIVQGVTHD